MLYETILDEKARSSFVNVNRWFLTISNQDNVKSVVGEIKLCVTPAASYAKKYAELHQKKNIEENETSFVLENGDDNLMIEKINAHVLIDGQTQTISFSRFKPALGFSENGNNQDAIHQFTCNNGSELSNNSSDENNYSLNNQNTDFKQNEMSTDTPSNQSETPTSCTSDNQTEHLKSNSITSNNLNLMTENPINIENLQTAKRPILKKISHFNQ